MHEAGPGPRGPERLGARSMRRFSCLLLFCKIRPHVVCYLSRTAEPESHSFVGDAPQRRRDTRLQRRSLAGMHCTAAIRAEGDAAHRETRKRSRSPLRRIIAGSCTDAPRSPKSPDCRDASDTRTRTPMPPATRTPRQHRQRRGDAARARINLVGPCRDEGSSMPPWMPVDVSTNKPGRTGRPSAPTATRG